MLHSFEGLSPKIAPDVFVASGVHIIGDVEIGSDSSIWFGSVLRGDIHRIRIGKRTNIQDLSMLHVNHYTLPDKRDGRTTIIGDDVTIGHHAMLHGCIIEDACLIGMRATILDDAHIGKESIVGAGALVTKGKIFPPRSLIIGSPAKVVRQLSDEEVASLYDSAARYVEYKNRYM